MSLEWREPPPPKPRKVDEVAAQLKAHPGEWARIDTGPVKFLPWWQPLDASPLYEVRYVRHEPSQLFGPRDVYARYRPPVGGQLAP